MTRHVIIGGIGFVGANLALELVKRGHETIVAGKRSSADKRPLITGHLERSGVKLALSDRIDRGFLEGLGADVYYHVAGAIAGSLEAQRVPHVRLLDKAVRAASSIGARVVYVRSIGAIGTVRGLSRGSKVLEEDVHLEPGRHVHESNHETTKAEGERLLVSSSKMLRGKWAIMRPGLVFGPWGYHVEWRLSYRLASRGIAVDFSRRVPHVYSGDLAKLLADSGEGLFDGRWVNAVDPLHPRMLDITMLMCTILGRKCLRLNAWPVLSVAGRMAPRSSPLRAAYVIMRREYFYSSRFLEGYEWTPLESQVREFVSWAKSHGLAP